LAEEVVMPRPSWTGHLRLSLVSCPIYLSPAVSESERIKLHQINPKTGNRIAQKVVDAETGDPVERSELVKGYEYERGQYVTLSKEEIDGLRIASSKTVDLTQFVDRDDISPLYFDAPYYVYPDGSHANEAFHVIAHAMAKRKKAAIGRVVLSNKERLVAVEPFEGGLLLSTLRAADEVRAAEFDKIKGEVDAEMVAMAETIIDRLEKKFDAASFHDRYQDALRALVQSKMEGKVPAGVTEEEPSNVIDLMAALKQSVAAEGGKTAAGTNGKKKRAGAPDRRQQNLLLPVKGGGAKARTAPAVETPKARSRKKA
jgi:DNA end-binding protein Ku